MDHVVKCTECGELSVAAEGDFGKTVSCAACGADFYLPRDPGLMGGQHAEGQVTKRVAPPLPATGDESERDDAALTRPVSQRKGPAFAGAICLLVGCVTMILLPLLPFVYVWLFLAAFVLGIVAIAQQQARAGLPVLLGAVFVPVVIGAVQALVVFGSVAAMVDGVMKRPVPRKVAAAAPVHKRTTRPTLPRAYRALPKRQPTSAARSPQPTPVAVTSSRPSLSTPAVPSAKQNSSYIERNGERIYVSDLKGTGPAQRALKDVLKELERLAKAYPLKETSVAKELVRQEIVDRAGGLLNDGRALTFSGNIKDVSSGENGQYVLVLKDVDGFEWQRRELRMIRLIGGCAFPVSMSSDEAQKLKPMTPVSVVGRIHFREYSSPLSHLGGAAAPAPLTILLSGCPTPLGFIDFGEYCCRIGGKDYGSASPGLER